MEKIMKNKASFSEAEMAFLNKSRQFLLANQALGFPIQFEGITQWEELDCVGYNPQNATLEAVISIKRSSGYSGNLCSNGSTEYVRFYVDFGSGWEDVGFSTVKAHDIPEIKGNPQHPLKYLVYLKLSGEKAIGGFCGNPTTPQVRAILSWNVIPPAGNPAWIPQYGNVKEAEIVLKSKFWFWKDVIDLEIVKKNPFLKPLMQLNPPLPNFKLESVPIEELKAKYDSLKANVADHRLLTPHIGSALNGNLSESLLQSSLTYSDLKKINIDYSDVLNKLIDIKINDNNANIEYEELTCVGLNPATDTLGAVIKTKRSDGYSGNLCEKGSNEYVAFWADWNNNGTFDEYLGTVAVNVHDIASKDGIYYAVTLPVDLSKQLINCNKPKIVKIRAILSWEVPPSTTDPNKLEYWGNRKDVLVQLRPVKNGTGVKEKLYTVSNVLIEDFDATTHLAYPIGISPNNNRPLGGGVNITGKIQYNSAAADTIFYRVVSSNDGINWNPVTTQQTFTIEDFNVPTSYPKMVNALSDGWIEYQVKPFANLDVLNDVLADWNTGSLNGRYFIRLEYYYQSIGSGSVFYSDIVTVILNNERNINFNLSIDGGDCHSYPKVLGATVTGKITGRHPYFALWDLNLQPASRTNGVEPVPVSRSVASSLDQGDFNAPWSIDASRMEKCGFTIRGRCFERTIFDNNHNLVDYKETYLGFAVV
jgi:hypothetical protein